MLSATNGLLAMEKDAVTGTPTLHLMVWPPGGGKTTPLREPNIGRCAPTYSG